MKIKILLLSLVIFSLEMTQSNLSHAQVMQNFGVNFQIFYNELSPYGDWIMDQEYGYIWVPFVGRNFQPYATNGYWTMTNYGNTWVSMYDWGWAPFHYGRWFWDNYLGWAWIPGYEWGPAWVTWRSGGGYLGWAPLGPQMNINISNNPVAIHWVFVPQRKFRHRMISRHYIHPYQTGRIINNTTIINNTYVYNNQTYYSGPSRREIERVTRRQVAVYDVQDRNQPGRTAVKRNSLEVYRPSRELSNNAINSARPSRVVSREEYRANAGSNTNGRYSQQNANRNQGTSSNVNSPRRNSSSSNGGNADVRTESQGRGVSNRNSNGTGNRNNNRVIQNENNGRNTRSGESVRPSISQPSTGSNPNQNRGGNNSGENVNKETPRRNNAPVIQNESNRSNSRTVESVRPSVSQPSFTGSNPNQNRGRNSSGENINKATPSRNVNPVIQNEANKSNTRSVEVRTPRESIPSNNSNQNKGNYNTKRETSNRNTSPVIQNESKRENKRRVEPTKSENKEPVKENSGGRGNSRNN